MADKASGVPTEGALGRISDGEPALVAATRIGERAARVGFDWPDLDGVRAKVGEELAELDEAIAAGDRAHVAEELGDLLFTLTRLGARLGVDCEAALVACIGKFRQRFEAMEGEAAALGRPLAGMTLEEMDVLWRHAKEALRGPR